MASDFESTSQEAYCPHLVVHDLQKIGFSEKLHPTEYGSVATYVRRVDNRPYVTVLIHGVASDSSTWSPMLVSASEGHVSLGNVLLVDLPGFGKSENRLDTLWIPQVGKMIVALARAHGFERIRLGGHSMGGFLALDMAARFPEQIESVHVAAGSFFGILETIKNPFRNIFKNPRTALIWDLYWLLCKTGIVGASAINLLARAGLRGLVLAPFVARPNEMKNQVVETLLSQLNPRGVVLTARNGPDYDAVQIWGSIQVPIIAVFANRDQMVTARDAQELSRVHSESRIRWVGDAGHLMLLERPLETLLALGFVVDEDHDLD